jgi:hypothetical protein
MLLSRKKWERERERGNDRIEIITLPVVTSTHTYTKEKPYRYNQYIINKKKKRGRSFLAVRSVSS